MSVQVDAVMVLRTLHNAVCSASVSIHVFKIVIVPLGIMGLLMTVVVVMANVHPR